MAVEAKNFGIEGVKKALHENDSLESFDSQTLAKFCQELQIKTSGTKKELIKRLLPLKDEDLFDRRVNSICKEYKFSTALSREDIPPPAAGWKCDTLLFPKVQKEVIKKYQSSKRQGMIGQFRKAQRMFSSRRMKTIKAFKDGNKLFVKSTILKSFSSEVTRTATLLFVNNIPLKGFCECPVGKCGLCCHVIVILLQLEHLTLFNELFLSLTCTQKLQKWHRPTKCSKSKITTACHIRLKYFRNARSARQVVNTQRRQKKKIATSQGKVDSCRDQSDWLKRDVSQMSSKVSDGISKCNVDVSNHFLQTLQKYGIKQSGLYFHLSFRSAYLSEIIHKEHDYAKQTPTNDESILKSTFTAESEDIWHRALVTSNASKSNKDISTDHYTSTDPVCNENFFCPEKTQTLLNLLTESQDEIITVKIPELKEVKPSLRNNQYIDVAQGTPEWLATRVGVITASKLPSLLGFCGNKEFDSSWFCIHNKVDEHICRPKKFKNFQRGNSYEKEALQSFSELTGSPVSSCGFFRHHSDPNYGASPDGFTEAFLVEVKTRAENAEAPLENVTGSHVIQTNFQMCCTGGEITFLQSYLPEKKCSNFFFIKRNNLLIDVMKEITDHILKHEVVTEWHHEENSHLTRLGKQLLGNVPNFDSLRNFRSWVNCMAKQVQKVVFR